MDAIVVDELRKRYGNVQALEGVSFAVRAGEVFGLLGPNGAGKSTTVKVLATLTKPDAGRAEVAGHDVVLQGMSGRALETRVAELLDLLGLARSADRVVRGYSGGMKRRLDVGLGLVHRPQVLFLDEPTTGLDPEARASMWEELERLAEGESLTILLTTHYMEEADELADRLAIVSRGRVIVEGTPEQLKQSLRGEAVEVERVFEASIEGRRLHSRVASGARAIPFILSALEAEGIGVEAVTTHRPSLDDVYLHYTGREFAAEDEQGRAGDSGEDGRR